MLWKYSDLEDWFGSQQKSWRESNRRDANWFQKGSIIVDYLLQEISFGPLEYFPGLKLGVGSTPKGMKIGFKSHPKGWGELIERKAH